MFYSHEILTSPEHGVATVWLAATLGPKSTTRKINRKAILDVNVSGACRVIISPEIPMALRLQGSMLYGVTRIYNQQCGYTLLDAQSMRDKMVSMFKLMPGGGLDPNVGKVKPSSLILPYDPTFLPETGLPGLNIDFSLFDQAYTSRVESSSFWSKSKSAESQSTFSLSNNIQIHLPDEVFPGVDDDVFGPVSGSQVKHALFGKTPLAGKEDEEGVLLQPDFEFDEEGNIVEFHSSRLSPRKRRKITSMPRMSEGLPDMPNQEEMAIPTHDQNLVLDQVIMDLDINTTTNQEKEQENKTCEGTTVDPTEIHRAPSRKRRIHEFILDEQTSLRNTDLYNSNTNYLSNMAQASKQKAYNKLPTVAKKNAAFWVYGKGLGGVGIGLGANREPHPLNTFSGKNLLEILRGEYEAESQEAKEDENPRGCENQERENLPDVEFARRASSVIDEHSQMPWNISASIHSSGQAQRYGSIGMSSEHRHDSIQRHRNRITSSSPLTGRSYLELDREDIGLGLGGSGLDFGDELDITRYLEDELASDREHISILSNRESVRPDRASRRRDISSLHQESFNFYEFVRESILSMRGGIDDGGSGRVRTTLTAFTDILPPSETSRVIATQAFMNILTLANEGWLIVSQGEGGGGKSRTRAEEIYLRVVEN